MANKEKKQYYCPNCKQTRREEWFYGTKNLEKYPEGKITSMCKTCMTLHVDNWDPQTYTWILEECDVPYIPEEWNKLMATYAKDPEKLKSSTTVIGKYLSKMHLKKWKDYSWKDTDFLIELADAQIRQTMQRQGYDIQDITTAIENSHNATNQVPILPPPVREE